MSLTIGQLAPDFEAETTFGYIRFYEWLGNSWGLMFSHPENYTPVCTTELGVVANLHEEFKSRNVKCIGLSVDNLASHRDWVSDIEEIIGREVSFPIIADDDKSIASKYQMIHSDTDANFTIRSVFIIGPDRKIRVVLTYPMAVGRNFDEILRVIDALQLSEDYNVVTPANWKQGDRVIISPGISDQEMNKDPANGYEEVRPYLRYVDQPS